MVFAWSGIQMDHNAPKKEAVQFGMKVAPNEKWVNWSIYGVANRKRWASTSRHEIKISIYTIVDQLRIIQISRRFDIWVHEWLGI